VTAPRGPAPARTGRGFPITFTRGPSSGERLQIDWDYAVPAETGERTHVGVLTYADAIAAIAGDDPRPLLVLRDCLACRGEDHAVLKHDKLNDGTYLLTRWFHCVKLPEHVTDYRHRFHALFDGEKPPHLFLCLADGTRRIDLSGGQSQTDTWKAMSTIARAAYSGSVDERNRGLVQMLDEYDRVDADVARLQKDLDVELERNGSKSARAQELRRRLQVLGADRQKLEHRERAILSLPLSSAAAPAAK
jgi:hypothetical protein